MATLEKIRSKGVLLLVVVGVALFAFIIGDFLNSGSTYFGQSKMNVITIGSEDITINEFQDRINELTEVYKIQTQQSQLSEGMMEQIRQSVFDNIVRERLFENAAEQVGITVTSKELFDLVSGENIHPIMQSLTMFVNPETGMFERTFLLNFLNSLNVEPQTEEHYQQIQQAKTFWLFWENLVRGSRMEEKYTALLTGALNANSLDAKFAFDSRLNTADVAYVMKSYNAIADSMIVVSDKDLKNEYARIKDRLEQEASRDLVYISFPIRPSEEDFARAQDAIIRLKDEFVNSDDIIDLVNYNSDIPFPTFSVSEQQIDPEFREFAFSGRLDSVVGPIFVNDTYKMARIIETSIAPDSVNIKHILVFEQDEETTQRLADSIINAVKAGESFAALAEKHSRNPNTARNGGEVGWIFENHVERELIAPIFYEKNDSIFAVKTNNGTQIILVRERGDKVPKVKLAVLARTVSASTSTFSELYNEAKSFVVTNNTVEKFEAAAREQGFVLRPANAVGENTPRLGNIPDSRKIIRWAFENNSRVVSDVFESGDEFIVAAVAGINKKGYRTFNDVREELKATVIRDKKAEMITVEFSDKLKQSNNINNFANLVSLPVETLTGINFASTRTAIGFEPAIVGTAPFMQVNTLSAPLKGNIGVFVLSPTQITASTAVFNEAQERTQIGNMFNYTVPQGILNVLKSNDEVVDKRSNFY